MAKFGKYAAEGSVETEATQCAVSGRELFPPHDGSVRERVKGTPYFFRVAANQYEYLTDEMRDELAKEATRGSVSVSAKGKPSAASEVKE